jgi:hypothetical protein
MLKRLIILLLTAFSGCAITDKSGTTHHVIVGFGVVSVSQTNTVARVVRTTAIGLSAASGPGSCFVGYGSGVTVSVCTNANMLIEVDQKPWKPIKIQTQ